MGGILVVKYPKPITSLKKIVKKFEMESSKALFKREREHSPTLFITISYYFKYIHNIHHHVTWFVHPLQKTLSLLFQNNKLHPAIILIVTMP